MFNDNGSYWQGYIGYPAIAFLPQKGLLEYRPEMADVFRGLPWKDINTKFKKDFARTIEYIFTSRGESKRNEVKEYAHNLLARLQELDLTMLGKKAKPLVEY